jgi:5-methylcytosine-specific restriction endonuclease McrA
MTKEEAGPVRERRKLIRRWNLDESELKFHGRLPGAEGRMFDRAIDRLDHVPPNPETELFDPLPTRAADALTELAAPSAGDGSAVDMVVFADLDALMTDADAVANPDNTVPIPNETARRLGCEAAVQTVIRDGERVIGVGRKSKKVPGWLRRLVYQRDGSRCQHPGCRNTGWLQVHHIQPWAHGGPTDLDNSILLCGFHHRHVYELGWHITGPPEARVFRRPDWTLYPSLRRPLEPRLAAFARSI